MEIETVPIARTPSRRAFKPALMIALLAAASMLGGCYYYPYGGYYRPAYYGAYPPGYVYAPAPGYYYGR